MGFWSNPDSARTTVQEIKTLKGWVTPWEDLHGRITATLEMAQLLETEPDAALQEEMARETDALDSAVEAFQLQAMLQGPDDGRDALLTIHPGAGGTESQDWAEMLMRMYVRWSERKGYSTTILDLLPGDEAVDDICEEMAADGVVGETLVNPPQPASNNDSPATAALGSVMAALQCKFRSPLNGRDWRPSWQPMTS